MDEIVELLPCPFCGNDNIGKSTMDDYIYIMCNKCGCGVESTNSRPELEPEQAWNQRVKEAQNG